MRVSDFFFKMHTSSWRAPWRVHPSAFFPDLLYFIYILRALFEKFRVSHREEVNIFYIWTVLHIFIFHKSMFQISSRSVVYYVFDSHLKWGSQAINENGKIRNSCSYLKGLIATQITSELDSTLGESSSSNTMVKRWICEFRIEPTEHQWWATEWTSKWGRYSRNDFKKLSNPYGRP